MSAVEIRQACRRYAEKFVDLQRDGFQRLGVFGEWQKPYLTMDPEYEAIIAETFFNLRFGQRRLVRHAPVNRLAPAIDITLREEGEKRLGDNRLILGVHRQVGFLPFSEDAQALEAVSLEVYEFFGV